MRLESCFAKVVSPAFVLAGIFSLSGLGLAQARTGVVSDAQIEAGVLKALAGAPELTTQSINTTTVYGTVTLSGSVRSEAQRQEAEQLAANAPGVKKVVDELTLGGADSNQQGMPGNQTPVAPSGDSRVLMSDGSYAPPAAGAQNVPQTGQQPTQQGTQEVPPPNGPDTDPYGRPLNAQQNGAGQPRGNTPPQGYGDPNSPQNAGQYGQAPNGQQPYGQAPYGQQPNGQPPSVPQQPYGQNPYGASPYGPQARQPYNAPYGSPQYGYATPQGTGPGYGQAGGQTVTVPSGSVLQVRVNKHLDSRDIKAGTPFDAIVVNDIVADGQVAIPRGASVQGVVVDATSSGVLKGRGELGLQLTQITLGGQNYPVATDVFSAHGGDKTIQTVNSAVGLGALGAIFGAVAGGGAGAAIGAGVGGAVGLGASAASGGGNVFIPSEAVLSFRLTQPASVTTVSQAELQRLGYGVPAGGRQLVRRYPPAPYYYGPTYYPYPRAYYRPYYYPY